MRNGGIQAAIRRWILERQAGARRTAGRTAQAADRRWAIGPEASIAAVRWARSHSSTVGGSITHSSSSTESHSSGTAETLHKRMLVNPDEVGRLFGRAQWPRALVLGAALGSKSRCGVAPTPEPGAGGQLDSHPITGPPTLLACAVSGEGGCPPRPRTSVSAEPRSLPPR